MVGCLLVVDKKTNQPTRNPDKQVKKRQQRALFILDSLKIDYEAIDITEPGNQEANERFRECKKVGSDKLPLPPQFFNGDTYCGVSLCYTFVILSSNACFQDWDDFFIASDEDTVFKFLKLDPPAGKTGEDEVISSKSPALIHESESSDQDEEGRKSVNGHVNGDDVDGEHENGVHETDVTDEDELTGDKSAAVTPSPVPVDDESMLLKNSDEVSKIGNKGEDEAEEDADNELQAEE